MTSIDEQFLAAAAYVRALHVEDHTGAAAIAGTEPDLVDVLGHGLHTFIELYCEREGADINDFLNAWHRHALEAFLAGQEPPAS